MSVYAIADLHLSLGTDKPMDVFRGWNDYVQRLEENWRSTVTPQDTVVIGGDISWAMHLEETTADFTFLQNLPGRKWIIKGNHDYWWTTRRKMDLFLQQNGWDSLGFIFNDAVAAEGTALCGTRGWFPEAGNEENQKIMLREEGRLAASLEAAKKLGLPPIVFLHYPPLYGNTVCRGIIDVMHRYGVRQCYYGHIHGAAAAKAFQGEFEGITMQLIAGDRIAFAPVKII